MPTKKIDDSIPEEIQRRGELNRCPACGSTVDVQAYQCPTCHNAFCYHCRARLLPNDLQLECSHQDCDYYAKPICSICDAKTDRELPPAVYWEPEDGYWPAWLFGCLAAFFFLSSWISASWSFLLSVFLFLGGGYAMQRYGWNLFGRERRVEHERRAHHYPCIRCHRATRKRRAVHVE
jgi:hypothetical protein